jgi:hypothetical protein
MFNPSVIENVTVEPSPLVVNFSENEGIVKFKLSDEIVLSAI